MELKKEKTLLVAYDEYGSRRGAIDLYTGTMYGVKGNELIGVPSCFKAMYRDTYSENDRIILKSYFSLRDTLSYESKAVHQRFESLISVGLVPNNIWSLRTDEWRPLKKDAIQYFKEHEQSVYSPEGFQRYTLYCNPFFKQPHEKWVKDAYIALITNYNVPENIVVQLLTRCELEHVKSFYSRSVYTTTTDIVNDIHAYYNLSMKLYGTVTVERNFLTHLGFLRYTYELRKNELIGQGLMMYNNDKRLAYEDDNFVVTYLLTPEDFHKEGEAQNNCVERLYMEKVANGETKVVAIRDKRCPEKSYITCEVSNDGKIIQYLRVYNYNVQTNTPAYDFYLAYQNHLNEVWNA